ncbi:hypothetical protein EDB82DRAFT_207846 [Fusarium venenatum]|uniref:uncharacterized protein n=1 Tax=Fusarium venenatum TaxID=56646 RepID=UPI001D8B0279|nr:hypothetical protein EDB82DRAFT_207846 [Fusarium venenatum]
MTKYALIKLESRDCFFTWLFSFTGLQSSWHAVVAEDNAFGSSHGWGVKGWRQGNTYHVMRTKIQMRTVHLTFVVVCMVYKYRHIFMSRHLSCSAV